MLPQEILCSKIASVTILGWKLSRSSYMGCGVLYPLFDCPCVHVLFF